MKVRCGGYVGAGKCGEKCAEVGTRVRNGEGVGGKDRWGECTEAGVDVRCNGDQGALRLGEGRVGCGRYVRRRGSEFIGTNRN